MCKKKNQALGTGGFTLLELVVVMAMIGILSGASFKLIKFSETSQNITLATSELKGVIRSAQTLALAPPIIKGDDDTTRRIICGFLVKKMGDKDNQLEIQYAYSVDNDVKDCRVISDIDDVCSDDIECEKYEERIFDGFTIGSVNIFFKAPYGEVFGVDKITITQNDGQFSKSIKVNKYGKINTVQP
jgi:prepilin-type N-terminal cleavage/methylation domain-containing protein